MNGAEIFSAKVAVIVNQKDVDLSTFLTRCGNPKTTGD